MSEALRQSQSLGFEGPDDTDIRSVPLIKEVATALIDHPFIGLRPFDEKDAPLFCGRLEQTDELLQRLKKTRLVATVGGSGCGKSSLVRAGLIPAVKAGFLLNDRIEWEVLMMKPGERPLQSLAVMLLQEDSSTRSDLIEKQVENLRSFEADAVIDSLGSALEKNKNILLVIDQFEEVFRFGGCANEDVREDAATFVSLLLSLTQKMNVPVYVVLTMRLDFIGDCSVYPGFAEAMNRSIYLVPRLSRQQRREAILGPTRMAGASIDPRLLDVLLNESDLESDQLPVLQHALMRTWEEWRKDVSGLGVGVEKPPIGTTHYERAGKLGKALNQHAEEALEGLALDITERLFRALTDTDSSNRQIRHPAKLSELVDITKVPREAILEILNRFRGDSRCFLVLSCEPDKGDPIIDISHESLIRNWGRLGRWVKKEADSAANYRRLEEATALYEEGKTGLWTDPQLQLALEWRGSNPINEEWARRVRPSEFFQITQWERPTFAQVGDFLDASRASRDDAKARQLRAQEEQVEQARELAATRQKWAAVAFGCAVVAIVLAFIAWGKASDAHEKSTTLLYSKLAQQSTVIAPVSPQKGVLLAVEALRIQPEQKKEREKAPENALRYALTLAGGRGIGLHGADISSLAVSPDSRWLVSGSSDGAAFLWDLEAPLPISKPVELAKGHPGSLKDPIYVAAAGNGVTAIGSYDGSVRVSGIEKSLIPPGGPQISTLTMTPDGRFLVAGTSQGILWLCDLSQKARPVTLSLPRWHHSRILLSELSPDGARLVTSDAGNNMAVWALSRSQTPRLVYGQAGVSVFSLSAGQLVVGHVNGDVELRALDTTKWISEPPQDVHVPVTSIALNPVDHSVVAVNQNRNVVVWDGQGKEYPLPFSLRSPEMSRVVSVKISQNGRWLAAISGRSQVFLWKLPIGVEPEKFFVLRGHGRPVKHLAFTANGRWLITGGADGTLRRWDLSLPDPSNEAIRRRAESVDLRSITLRNDRWLVTNDDDGKGNTHATLWDLTAPEGERGSSELPDVSAFDVSPRPQNDWLITGSKTDGSVSFWKLSNQGLAAKPFLRLLPRDVLPSPVTQVEMTPDRRFLLVLTQRSAPRLWNLEKRSSTTLDGTQIYGISQDSRWIILKGKDEVLRAWDLSSGSPEPLSLPNIGNNVRVLTFDGKGRLICGGQDGLISIYKLGDKSAAAQVFPAHSGPVYSLAVSPDNSKLATGGEDGTERIWDLDAVSSIHGEVFGDEDGTLRIPNMKSKEIEPIEPVRLPGHEAPVFVSLFEGNGQELLTVTGKGAVRRWRLPESALKEEAEAVVGRNMFEEEWRTYLPPNESYRETFPHLPLLRDQKHQAASGSARSWWIFSNDL